MCSTDFHGVDTADGVDQVVGLVDDDHATREPDAHCLPGGPVQEGVVGEQHQLSRWHRPPRPVVGTRPQLPPGGDKLLHVLDTRERQVFEALDRTWLVEWTPG